MKTLYKIGKLVQYKTDLDSILIGKIDKILIDEKGSTFLINDQEISESQIIATYSEDKKPKAKITIKRPWKAKAIVEIAKPSVATENQVDGNHEVNEQNPF